MTESPLTGNMATTDKFTNTLKSNLLRTRRHRKTHRRTIVRRKKRDIKKGLKALGQLGVITIKHPTVMRDYIELKHPVLAALLSLGGSLGTLYLLKKGPPGVLRNLRTFRVKRRFPSRFSGPKVVRLRDLNSLSRRRIIKKMKVDPSLPPGFYRYGKDIVEAF